jgi:fructokinase
MRKIYCFGEAVYDIIFKDEKPVDAKPGGAMLNIAVSLGRLNLPVSFIGDFANDRVGCIIKNFLKENKVDTSYITMYENAKSRIALAFLDNCNNADYSFYKIRVEDTLSIKFPELQKDDILLFGSYYGIKPEIRHMVHEFLKQCRANKAIIIYDPNFRKAHLNMLHCVKPFIEENIALADITKGSDEDFQNVFNVCTAGETFDSIKNTGCRTLIYTRNRHGVDYCKFDYQTHFPAIGLIPVSTVGAGDTFTAGMAWWIFKNKIRQAEIDSLSEAHVKEMINTGISFASDVCMTFDNYLSHQFVLGLKNTSQD